MADFVIPAAKTIRQRIIDALEIKLKDMANGPSGPNRIWQDVIFGDLDDLSGASYPCVGIDEGVETISERYGGACNYELSVFIHFRFDYSEGVANLERYKYYLGLLQLAVIAEHNLGNLAIDVQEESNSPAIVGQTDNHPGGSLSLIIKYRTMTHNPYKLPGEL